MPRKTKRKEMKLLSFLDRKRARSDIKYYIRWSALLGLIYSSHKINMNSLRTDDILGAKPRVRHMPKNLIRERQIPTSFLLNMESNPEWNQKPSYYDQELQSSRYSPVQYQNNDLNGYPFYARNRLTKEPRFTNYDFTKVKPSDLKERY